MNKIINDCENASVVYGKHLKRIMSPAESMIISSVYEFQHWSLPCEWM